MSRQVEIEDLIDAHDVARILGLKFRNSISEYQARYADMPRPVLDLGRGRPRLWLRPEVEEWAAERRERGDRRRRRRPTGS